MINNMHYSMKTKMKLLSLIAALFILPAIFISCSQNSPQADTQKAVATAEKEVVNIPITFQGIPIEGSADAFLDSLKCKGFKIESGNYNLKNMYALISGTDGMSYFTCTPPKGGEVQEAGIAFYNNELCHICAKLKPMAVAIDDLTNAFSKKFSVDIKCHKNGELYSAEQGNIKVSFAGYGYATQVDYYNMTVQDKIHYAKDQKDARAASNTLDAL